MKNKKVKAILAEHLSNYQTELIEVIDENTLPEHRQNFYAVAKALGCVRSELLKETSAPASFLKDLKEEVDALLNQSFLPTCIRGLEQASYALKELLDEY